MENYSNNNEEAIAQFELFLLKTLNWQISPITANTWLNIYLQIANMYNLNGNQTQPGNYILTQKVQNCVFNTKFLLPSYSKIDYLKAVTLIDLCLFDVDSIKYKYSQLAASAMYYMVEPSDLTFMVTGYTFNDLDACIEWMSPYAEVTKEVADKIQIKKFSSVDQEDSHNIQLYYRNLDLWVSWSHQ
jgi:cyclin E